MIDFIKREISHYSNLPEKTKKLIISYFYYATAYPIISIFVSAFIWKNNNNISYLIFFRIGQFFTIPLAFLLGGILLKAIRINLLYFIGAILIAVSSVLIIFFKNNSPYAFVYMGILLGIGTGLYWVNRNYLTLKETNEENRSYFLGLLFSFATFIGLIVSLLTGWLIVFGMSYQFLIIISFILIFFSGLTVLKNDYKTPKISKLLIKNSSSIWTRKRFIHLGIGFVEGLSYIIPGLLILTVLGNEGMLGSLMAASSIISALLIYFYGRKSHTENHKSYFILSTVLGLATSLLIAGIFNKLSVIVYSLLNGLIINFMWLTIAPPVMKNIDLEVGAIEGKRFSYILDSEFFLNGGRVFGLIICLLIADFFGVMNSLRFSPLILSMFQIFLFVILEQSRKKIPSTMI